MLSLNPQSFNDRVAYSIKRVENKMADINAENRAKNISEEDVDEFQCSKFLDSSVRVYFNSLRNISLLTAEEERQLGLKIKYGTDEEKKAAKEELVKRNLRYSIAIAKKYVSRSNSMSLLDLIQEGNIGLMIAAEKYDVDLGYRFTTYATHWITQNIARTIANKDLSIRFPVYVSDNYKKVSKMQTERIQSGEKQYTKKELMKILKLTEDGTRLLEAYSSSRKMTSLDKPVLSEGDSKDYTLLGDFVPDDTPSPEDVALEEDKKECINDALSILTEREKEVISMRFGLTGDAPKTLEAIGNTFGVTRERIRQIENSALRKLKNPKRAMYRRLKELYYE